MTEGKKDLSIMLVQSRDVSLPVVVADEIPARGREIWMPKNARLLIRTELADQTDKSSSLPIEIVLFMDSLHVRCPAVDTMTELPGYGIPIIVEFSDGKLRLFSYDDQSEGPSIDKEWEVFERQFPYELPEALPTVPVGEPMCTLPSDDAIVLLRYIEGIFGKSYSVGKWFEAKPGVAPDHPFYKRHYVEQAGYSGAISDSIRRVLKALPTARQGDTAEPLSDIQKFVLEHYAGGHFSYVKSMEEAEREGDGLVPFLLRELSYAEGCEDSSMAVHRLENVIAQVRELSDAFVKFPTDAQEDVA